MALNNMFSGGYDLGYNVYTVPEGQDFIGPNGKLNPNAIPAALLMLMAQNTRSILIHGATLLIRQVYVRV